MNKPASWVEKKIYLCKIIKQVSQLHGGDEEYFLNDYCKDILMTYGNDLDKPIACFESLLLNL